MTKRIPTNEINPLQPNSEYAPKNLIQTPENAAISTKAEIEQRKKVTAIAPTKCPTEKQTTSLFGGINSFEAKTKDSNKEQPGLVLFGKSSNIFSTGPLFGNNSTSLFGGKESANLTTLFASNPVQEEEDGDGGEDAEEIQKEKPALTVDKSAPSPYTKVIQLPLNKMKAGKKNLGNGTLSIEKTKDNKIVLLVFRNSIGKVLYNGIILPKISKIESPINGKSYKYELYCLCILKAMGKITKSVSKLLFNNEQDLKGFTTAFTKECPEQSKVVLCPKSKAPLNPITLPLGLSKPLFESKISPSTEKEPNKNVTEAKSQASIEKTATATTAKK